MTCKIRSSFLKLFEISLTLILYLKIPKLYVIFIANSITVIAIKEFTYRVICMS